MIWPSQPQYEDFIEKFMRLLFSDGDNVALAGLDAYGNWSNISLTLDEAIAHLLANPDTPNLYFRASAHDGSRNYAACNCTRAQALFLDIDYGSVGHKRKSPFKTVDDALCYLLTLPLRPSVAWHTGHGLQCAFLLKEPCVFPAGGGAAESLSLYRDASEGLASMAMADSAFTPEHAYRVPLTINSKAHAHPGTPDVRGRLLWLEDWRRFGLSEIAEAVKGYGIADLLNDTPALSQAPEHDVCDYGSLPQDLRDAIEASGAERSDRLFGIVGWMVRLGYGDDAIAAAVAHGTDFVEKFGHRQGGLGAEVRRCAAKIREGRYVYGGKASKPVRVYNVPVPVALNDCSPLTPEFEAVLGRYGQVTDAKLLPRVRDAARFHEHLHSTRASGVIESGCGAGKSVWALCHIALHARGARYVYVTETVEALHRAADVLAKLTDAGVGRVHGFNAAACKSLCGAEHSWRECRRNDPGSACAACAFTSKCPYYTRDRQMRQPILCMTHAGFIRAMEDGSEALVDANVIIDEGLSPFDSWSATHDELRRLASVEGVPQDLLQVLFPYTALANAGILKAYGVDGSDAYARRNFVYRSEKDTAALAPAVDSLRQILARGGAGFGPNDTETVRDTVAGIVNFFRSTVRCDASYAYTETRDGIECKRSGFDLGGGGEWRSLWMLNASASLAPFPYPSNMAVYACPDLKGNSALVTLHVLRANPTKARQDLSVRLAQVPMVFGQTMRRHRRVLVCADKDSERVEEIEDQVRRVCGEDAQVTVLSRGRIKGVNTAGDCTLCLLQGLSTFTGISDCALHACLQYRRTFPDTHVFNDKGQPLWDRDGMRVPAMRDYYALRSLDEIYQAVWRTAVRNDRKVEAVVVVPDPNWLVALYRTVMPEFVIGSAYKEKAGAETFTRIDGAQETRMWNWVWDDGMYGLGVICMQPGQEITKTGLAQALGYSGEDAWEKNKPKIMGLLGDFFEDGHSNRWLRRKAGAGA
jgi:hypothetical protein